MGGLLKRRYNLKSTGGSAWGLLPFAMDKFERRVRPFATLVPLLESTALVYVVIAILSDPVPGIKLSHSFLELVSDLGCTLEIDNTCGA